MKLDQSTIPERYELGTLLGSGAAGDVYRVHDQYLDIDLALKVLTSHDCTETELQRFQREAQTAGNLNHPNIVKIFDFGLTSDNAPYMVMELIEGRTLRALLKKGQPADIDSIVEIFDQICAALAYAHDNDVIHRDIKPSNIMLVGDNNDQVKIVDFGIAKHLSNEGQDLTKSGAGIGTPLYMAPEQIKGDSVDKRSDIYAVGTMLFQALTGSTPFSGSSSMEIMTSKLAKNPPSLAEINDSMEYSADIENVIGKCIALDRAARYSSISDLRTNILRSLFTGDDEIADAREEEHSSSSKLAVSLWIAVSIGLLSLFILPLIMKEERKPERQPVRRPEVKLTNLMPAEFQDKSKNLKFRTEKLNDTTLRHIAENQNITDDAFRRIDSSLRQYVMLRNLYIDGSALGALAKCGTTQLYLHNCDFVTDSAFKEIAKITTLERLDLYTCDGIRGERISDLAGLKNFRSLFILELNVSDKVFEQLAKVESLRTISVKECPRLDGRGLDKLGTMPELYSLALSGDKLSDDYLRQISNLKRLRFLSLFCANLSASTLRSLKKLPDLRELTLIGIKLTDSYVSSLSSLQRLKRLNLKKCTISVGLGDKLTSGLPKCKLFIDGKLVK